MIISNLVGGLGNQMFQYACGRALSLRVEIPLSVSTDQLKVYNQHNGFELYDLFNIKATVAGTKELRHLLGYRSNPKLRRFLGRSSMTWAAGGNWCNEPSDRYWSGIRDINNSVYLHGYWQSESYFSDYADVIREDFTFRDELDELDSAVLARMKAGMCASLHVRRGDYLAAKSRNLYSTCSIEYYVSAVRFLRKKFPQLRIFAFSDDTDWVVTNLMPKIRDLEVVSHNVASRSANDMRLMSMADHHIIANSSFSWWSAWLSQSQKKIVIAPCKWFADGRLTPTLLPTDWITLNN